VQGPVFKTGVRRLCVSRVGSTPISFRHLNDTNKRPGSSLPARHIRFKLVSNHCWCCLDERFLCSPKLVRSRSKMCPTSVFSTDPARKRRSTGSTPASVHRYDQEHRPLPLVDEQNRKTVYKRLGPAELLPDDVIGLYDQLRFAVAPHLPDVRAELAVILYAACRKHIALGITSLFRCYSSQAFRETRAAVEAAAIAGAVRRDEESYRILRDDRDEASRKIARNHFKARKIFVGGLSRLQKTYDKASELSHTNRRTFGPNINTAESSFSLQDFAKSRNPGSGNELSSLDLWRSHGDPRSSRRHLS
jgi:hypothetical protein